jgi:regulator of protease activity HflC (stomatin/prohibitin superfamily)
MTADRVTLRINAVATLRVTDAERYATAAADARELLYRDAQLALRATVGTRTLDDLLADKDGVVAQLETHLRARAQTLGMEVLGLGIRDVILPGEMRDLLNKVTEARKAAEAAFISRREETAIVRSQANTARLFESNPTLMRLRELEVLEKITGKAKLSVMLGDKGLTDRMITML